MAAYTALISFIQSLADRFDREEGQGLAEYALILTFVALAVIFTLGILGGAINTVLSNVANRI